MNINLKLKDKVSTIYGDGIVIAIDLTISQYKESKQERYFILFNNKTNSSGIEYIDFMNTFNITGIVYDKELIKQLNYTNNKWIKNFEIC